MPYSSGCHGCGAAAPEGARRCEIRRANPMQRRTEADEPIEECGFRVGGLRIELEAYPDDRVVIHVSDHNSEMVSIGQFEDLERAREVIDWLITRLEETDSKQENPPAEAGG